MTTIADKLNRDPMQSGDKTPIDRSGVDGNVTGAGIKTLVLTGGATGSFTTTDSKTITVTAGVITSIV